MNRKEMKNVATAMHRGMHRANPLSKTGELNVDENLKKRTTRRQCFFLNNNGVHYKQAWSSCSDKM